MGRIQELSEQLANQIAAGEVVERPASVVKELVENAIDAGSTQIDIFIEEGGMKKIQLIDNGEGIEADDVENAFKRHATSKIHTRDDLFRIRSLGFRGEALPSIASVSEIELETSTGKEAGTYIRLTGGKIVETKPHSMRQGTKITVENLFFNTPARLKYVKSLQAEVANIGDIVNRLALSHPHIAFRLTSDGNALLKTSGNGDLKQTIAGIYGLESARKMVEISGEDLDFRLSGYVSLPELTRARKNYLSIIINGRYIKNFLLNKAIVEGYGSKLMVGRFPIAVLEIQMDPLLVDVNVHPTKQEVRLSKEGELMALIRATITEALSQQSLIPNGAENLNFNRPVAKQGIQQTQQLDLNLSGKSFESKDAKGTSSFSSSQDKAPFRETLHNQGLAYDASEGKFYVPEFETTIQEPVAPFVPEESTPLEEKEQPVFEEATVAEVKTEEKNNFFPELEYFGQMHGTYLFAQSHEGLYIVDQHAAQERIKYEYYRVKIGDVGDGQQALLVPLVLEYPNNDAMKIKASAEKLAEVGIFVEDFGQNTFVIRSHPSWYPQGEEEATLREMIDLFLSEGKVDVAKFREATAIMMSCKQSIKANHHLDERQARQLLADLALCENPYNCPHGRPVLIHFTNKDMEKMFKRIQDPH